MKSRSGTGGLVYSTESGRMCPDCRQPLALCVCKLAQPRPAGDGIVRVSRETKGRGGKTVTLVRGLHEQGVRPTVIAKTIDRSIEEAGWVDATAVSMFGVPGKLRDLWFDRRLRALKKRHGWFPLIALNQTAAADIAISGDRIARIGQVAMDELGERTGAQPDQEHPGRPRRGAQQQPAVIARAIAVCFAR